MAVKGSATVTLTQYRDIQSVTRYYKLRPAGSSAPLKPETKPPSSDWTDSEPDCDISKELYFCDLTIFSNGQWEYSKVSKSSSYEAAKEAYNRAQSAKDSIDNLEIGGRNYLATNRCIRVVSNGIIFEPDGNGGIIISGENNTPSGYGTAYCFPTGVMGNDLYYSLFAGTYTLSLSGSEHYVNMLTDSTKFYYRLKRDSLYGTNIPYSWVGNAVTFTLTEDVEKVYVGFGFYSSTEIVEGTIYFKLEKGNKATDWTPAPEDVDAGIANAQTTADTAKANAAAAQSTADTAKANAATAQTAADTAKANAATAQTAANNAQTSADNAQTGVDSLNDSVYGVQTFNYILNGVTIPVYKREDGTYYYILNDEEVTVAESALVHDADGDLTSYQEGGIYEDLDIIAGDIDAIDKKVDGFDARADALHSEIQDNSLIARKNARVVGDSLIITNDTATGDVANLLNYLQLNPASIVIYGNGKDIVTIAKTNQDSGYMEMRGTSLFIAQESRLSTVRLRSAEKNGKLALVAGSDGHVSLKEVLD